MLALALYISLPFNALMQVFEKKGSLIFKSNNSDLFVDSSGLKNKTALITHAHSDHAKTSASNTYFMTPQTASLIGADEKGFACEKVPFKKKFDVNGFECCFHSSGHILGSAQLEVCNGSQAVLTSDFKLQKSILFDGAEILPSETLVIESTFGSEEFVFPQREQVYENIIKWAHENLGKGKFLVLGGYSTGKAQELTKIATELLNETPLVFSKVFEQNKIYETHGVKLGDFIELNHNLRDSNVLIMPPQLINDHLLLTLEHQLGKKVEVAIATGWKNFSKYKTFPLSDHADFNSLLEYVKQSNPKLVLTTHGFKEHFARVVQRKFGIPARPLSNFEQKNILEF